MRRVISYFKPYTFKIILLFLSIALKTISMLLIPNEMGLVIREITLGDASRIPFHFSLMISLSLISFLAHISQNYLSSRIISGFQYDLRKALFEKVENLSLEELNDFETSSLITRTTSDIQMITQFFTMFTRLGLTIPFMGLGGVYLAIKTAKDLSWIILVAVSVMLILIIFLSLIVLPRSKRVQKLIDKLNLLSRESLTGIRVIRAFNATETQTNKYKETNYEYYKNNLIMNLGMASLSPLIMLISSLAICLVIYFGANLVNLGQIEVDSIVVYIQYLNQILFSFIMATMVIIIFPRVQVSINRVSEVLKKEEHIVTKANPTPFKTRGEISFEHVTFKYPDGDEAVLEDLNFTIHKGERVAFIGSTGSGKSTIISLIPRLYDVTSGKVMVNGVDVKDLDLKLLRDAIGFIPQKANLFKGSLLDNIKFTYEEASEAEVIRALKVAQAYDFVMAKEEKLAFEVSQNGKNLSGGQRQRISIARSLVKAHDFLILDDSLSALDYKTASNLQKALNEEFKDTTIIYIAQRVSSIMHADKIIVLDNGKVESIGTHQELLKKSKVYLEIASSQLSKEELGL